jgi:hypothetical protein
MTERAKWSALGWDFLGSTGQRRLYKNYFKTSKRRLISKNE